MVLKRILVTTLGALGLGALAAGPASAQQVPAPDLFDDQVNCSMHVMPQDAMANTMLGMTLMETVGMGTAIADADADGVPDADSGFAALNAIINPMGSNCGAGWVTDADGMFLDAMGEVIGDQTDESLRVYRTVSGSAGAVGAGYTAALDAYLATRTADAAVKTAQDALDALLKDEVEDGLQTAAITTARETLATAETAQTKANEALNAAGDGPINMAGIAEWRAKFAVEDAVSAYNTAVTGVTTASTALDAADVTIDSYVGLRETALIDGLVDANGNVNIANVRNYANATGNNAAVQDAMTGEITNAEGSTITGNFDAAGNLLIPMTDTDATDAVKLEPNTEEFAYMALNTRLTSVNDTVEALEKLQTDNKNALLQPAIDEAVRRAKLEQAHYQGQFDAMVANTDDLDLDNDGDATTMPASVSSLYNAYTAAVTKRDNAGVTLETAFAARVARTSEVVAAFTNPQDFYQQLVDRREFEKASAEAEVTRLAGLTGEEAPTEAATKAAADAVEAAQKAVDAATMAQAAFQSLLAEDSPVKDLVEELLLPDAEGDDGGELVDAIIGAYDAADAATTTAENAKATADTVAEAVAGLTGDEGAVSANAAAISENSDNITDLDGRVTMNEDAIADHDMKLMQKKEYIDNLGAEIGFNPATGEGTGEGGMSRIDTNEAGVAANKASIGENRTMIGTNVTNIAANATAIMAEQTAREEADTMLGGRIDKEAMDRMAADEELMGHITTNAGNIVMNEMSIGTNAGNISSNSDAIAANMNSIGSNASAISDNRNMIGELSDDLDVVRAGVAASMALAGMPAINGRGISIGVGSFDGESAFAVGFQIQGEMASFKVGVTSASGATGASAGVGFQF